MRVRLWGVAVAVLFVAATAGSAQEAAGRIEGRVVAPDGSGVGGVTVELAGHAQLALTESEVRSVSRRPERIVEAPAAMSFLPAAEIERESAGGQLAKLLEFTTGAELTQGGLYEFNLNVRGFNDPFNRRVLTLVDGRDVSMPSLGTQEWAAIGFPLDDLESVELVRGPGSALYGTDAFNGVLNMITKAPRYSQGGRVRVRWPGPSGLR